MYKLVLSLFAFALFLSSCGNAPRTEKETSASAESEMTAAVAPTDNVEKWIIASEMGDCVGVAPMKCLMVKKGNQAEWEFFYSPIEGFNYEPGYEYEIEVKKEEIEMPMADRSSITYTLVKEISKTKKQSENLPVKAK